MQIGYCARLDKAELLKGIGYDFIEVPLLAFDLTNQQNLDDAKRAVAGSPLPTRVFNSFFPYDFRLAGADVDTTAIRDYLGRVADLTHTAGAEVAVMGSAWSRNVPDGWERSRAEEQLLEAYSWAADAFEGSGVVIGIEPQNRKEANIIISVAEAVSYAARINRPGLKVIADFYHMDEEQEPLDALDDYREWIVHIQLADTGRNNPGTGSYDYDTFFSHLKRTGYPGHISVELMHEIPVQEMQNSLHFLRDHWST